MATYLIFKSMKNSEIIKITFHLITTKTKLWFFGIFLSSGFNVHIWYLASWLKRSGYFSIFASYLTQANQIYLWVCFSIAFMVCMLVFVVLKLWFLAILHPLIHSNVQEQCNICILKGRNISDVKLVFRNRVIWQVFLTSLITIGFTTAVLSALNLYFMKSEPVITTQIVLLLSLLFILVAVSLWNLSTTILIFYYNLNFPKASAFATDLLLINIKKVTGFTATLTTLFILVTTAGGLVLFHISKLLGATPVLLFTDNLQSAWQWLVYAVATTLFLLWLAINNIFFNINLVILFDSFIKTIRDKEVSGFRTVNPIKPAVTHHSELKP